MEIKAVPAGEYDVRVSGEAREQIWSQTGLKPSAGKLHFEIPAQAITTGDYQIVVISQPTHTPKSYRFQAKVMK